MHVCCIIRLNHQSAFFQSIWIVNSHVVECDGRYSTCRKRQRPVYEQRLLGERLAPNWTFLFHLGGTTLESSGRATSFEGYYYSYIAFQYQSSTSLDEETACIMINLQYYERVIAEHKKYIPIEPLFRKIACTECIIIIP